MSRFFINRPIFAWVLAIATMLAGVLALRSLPVSQYPDVSPPAVAIVAAYPGASAQTVQDTVAQVIEQQMNGLDGLRYIQSQSNADGSMVMIVTFEQGNGSGYRPSTGAEQTATCDATAAAGSSGSGNASR